MRFWVEKASKLTSKPISVMPNAGKPKNIDGRNIYLTNPEYMGEYAKHFVNAGASIIGGCCGTGPEHIKKMRAMLDSLGTKKAKSHIVNVQEKNAPEVDEITLDNKSRLGKKFANKEFTKFVELLAPRGINTFKELERSADMKEYGIDVINIPDGPRASARMSAGALALQIENKVGIETVLHFVCRDRNVIGIQSDLMGFYSLGLKNILAITGDPPKLGTYPDATAVYDIDSIGLTNVLKRLNKGQDVSGAPIGEPTGFTIGVGCNPGSIDSDNEIKRLDWKYKAGAEYVITQPVFDVAQFDNFFEKANNPILKVAGIWPLISLRNAQFMNNEVPGVIIPKAIIDRMRKWEGDKESSIKEGVQIATEMLDKMKNFIDGVQISAPFGRTELVKEVLSNLDL
jgi:homocysteine S-methyltransferase